MGFNSNTGTVNITGSVTATTTPTEVTVSKIARDTLLNNSSATLGTVGASKIWKILSVSIAASSVTANCGVAKVQLNGATIASIVSNQGGGGYSVVFPYGQTPTVAATQTVTLVADAVVYATATVTYVEEAV
jgi:hypothetical protein